MTYVKIKTIKIVCIATLFFMILVSCHPESTSTQLEKPQLGDNKYDSGFPVTEVSGYLREILKSINLVSVLTIYESYYFDKNTPITKADLIAGNNDLNSHNSVVFEQPSSGTATLVYKDNDKVAFITCAHIVNNPDTIITYHPDSNGKDTPNINYFIIKVRQTANIISQPTTYDFEILALDEVNDIAVIGKVLDVGDSFLAGKPNQTAKTLKLSLGNAKELDWGSFVYILGFPRAKKMISTAIVSSPNYDTSHSFLLDATLQKGISGGIILAIRDGVPNFELVGMAKGISGKTQYTLVPYLGKSIEDWETFRPYTGDIHIERQEIVEPGMLYATSIETILLFLEQHKESLQSKGYKTELFFK